MVSCSRGDGGQLQRGDTFAVGKGQELAGVRDPVVVEHRVHPLLPLGPLMHEHVPAPDPGTEIEQVRRRDP